MIIFRPIDAIFASIAYGKVSRFYSDEEWLLVLAHFARQFHDPRRLSLPWEIFNLTSGIGCRSLDGACAEVAGKDAHRRLAKLFSHTGLETEAGMFLWRCGLRSPSDLYEPLSIATPRVPRWSLPWWGNQAGRWFRKPGPNPSHPEARWVEKTLLRYHPERDRWSLVFFYSYPHDSSTWCEGVRQKRGEGLDRFGARVSAFIEERFEPEDRNAPLTRPHREKIWHRVNSAMRTLFPWGTHVPPDYAKQIADLLCEVPGVCLREGRFGLTPRRLSTLKRWAREAQKSAA